MRKKQYKPSNHRGLQVITLCISTAMVLILLRLRPMRTEKITNPNKMSTRGTGDARTGYD